MFFPSRSRVFLGMIASDSHSRMVGVDFIHSRSRSRTPKCHSRSPLLDIPWDLLKSMRSLLQKLWRFAKCQEFNYWTCSFLAGLRFLYLNIQLSFSADVEKFCRSGLSNKWRRFKLWDSPADFSTQLFIFEYTEKKSVDSTWKQSFAAKLHAVLSQKVYSSIAGPVRAVCLKQTISK